jgi:hypothetical protein
MTPWSSLLHSESPDDIAYVDPATMNMHFGAGLVADDDRERAVREGVSAVLPLPALAHEVAHVWQVTTTAAGIRWFWDAHVQMRMLAAMLNEAGAAADGLVGPEVLLDPSPFRDSGAFRARFDIANALTTMSWYVDGGHSYQTDELERLFGGPPQDDRGMLAYPHDRIGVGEHVRFFDLGQVARPPHHDGRQVLLGTKHLFEGLSGAIEGFRHIVETPGMPLAEVRRYQTLRFLPFEPYGVAAGMYAAIVQRRLGDHTRATGLLEIMAIIDAALNMDDWLSVLARTHEVTESDLRFPFHNYLRLLEARADLGTSVALRDGSEREAREFQEALLRAAGVPITDLAAITEAAISGVDLLFTDLKSWSPVPAGLLEDWRRLFIDNLGMRRDIGGGSPFFEIARAPRAVLQRVVDRVPLRQWGMAQLSEDEATDEARQAFQGQMLFHLRPLLMEWAVGRRRCDHFDGPCRLSERPACDGLTAELSPRGSRCAREAMTAHLMENFGITDVCAY